MILTWFNPPPQKTFRPVKDLKYLNNSNQNDSAEMHKTKNVA